MVESSKILTVSYGTFSCTLEGFEDSFSTMKAIAEYFRDLAAEDRFFGAEPPVPDAEMLGRIAEREIARRVEARKSETGVHLVATAQDQEEAPAMPPVATPPAALTDDIDSFFAASDAAAIADDAMDDMDAVADDAADTTPDAPNADYETTALAAAPAHPDPNSVAAKLQRIQAVVGKTDALADADFNDDARSSALPDVSEDQISDDSEVSVDVPEEALQDDQIAAPAVEADADVAQPGDTEPGVTDTTEFDTVAVEEPDAGTDMTEDANAAAPTPADVTSDETDAQISQVLRNLERAGASVPDDVEASAKPTQDTAAQVNVADVLGTEAPKAEEKDAVAADVATKTAATEKPAPAKNGLRARILRVTKKAVAAEPETAPATPAPISDLDGAEELTAFAEVGSDALSPDAEADLQAELAALSESDDTATAEAQIDAELPTEEATPVPADATEAVAEAVSEPVAEAPVRPRRASLPDTNDADMTRMMEQADEELSNPEGSRRRAAIAQLKAAVAATEAARQLGDDTDPAAKTEDAFRQDLDQVVRPRRAERPEATPERTERARPGPLKLVASQRVDAEEDATRVEDQPVRARRVAKGAGDAAGAASFTDFAAEMGATELPDLLEAAAAYTAYVEGEAEFSRPQIMRKVQASSDTAFSREDGLRSFGTLLRQGRINKAGNGRFQISDQTRFKPEQKAG